LKSLTEIRRLPRFWADMQAEARKREEVKNPAPVAVQRDQEESTGMGFLWSWSICGLTTRRLTTLNLTTGPSVTWFGDGLRSGGGIQKLYEVLKSRYQKRDSGKPWVFCIILEQKGRAVL